jgi:hypothetical protein
VYSNSEVDTKQTVTFHETSGSISNYLREAFPDNELNYEFENNYIILSKRSILSNVQQPGSTQQTGKRITGIVTDTNGEPVIGANVVEKGTINGTVTDVDGNFSLTVADNAVLQVSYIGYTTQEISVLSTVVGGGLNPL